MDKTSALAIYNALSRPPASALKAINGGRLNGKTDINPQWRYKAMTEQFGLAGIGWKYTIDRLWTEPGTDGQVFAWALVSVYVKDGDTWGEAVPGVGGNFLIEKESKGMHNNDEGFKMAITDALGTALKIIGVAADIHAGMWDGSKYKDAKDPNAESHEMKAKSQPIGKSPEQGMKEQALALLDKLGLDAKVKQGMMIAHGGKIVEINGQKVWQGINWVDVLAELKARESASGGSEFADDVPWTVPAGAAQ